MTFNYISLQNRPRQCFYLFCFVTPRVQIVIKPLGLEKESLKFMKCHQHHSHPNENDSKLFKEIIHITMYTIFTFKWQMSQVAVKKKGQLKYFIFVLTHRLKHLDDFMWEVHLSDLSVNQVSLLMIRMVFPDLQWTLFLSSLPHFFCVDRCVCYDVCLVKNCCIASLLLVFLHSSSRLRVCLRSLPLPKNPTLG